MSSMQNPSELPADVPPSDTSSAETKSESLDSRDSANSYKVFLGRMPDSQSINGLAIRSIPQLLRKIFETDEFNKGIVPVDRLGADAPPDQLVNSTSRGGCEHLGAFARTDAFRCRSGVDRATIGSGRRRRHLAATVSE